MDNFLKLHRRYQSLFTLKTKSVAKQAQHYLCGLMQAHNANMERMVEVVPDSDWDSVQHFISDSPWEHQPILNQIARDANRLVGGHADSYLIIDESAFSKKGHRSVGVARQWNGRLGKVDHCQVGVFAALGCHDKVTLTDLRLYLPQEWTDDKARCRKAGIPEQQITYRSKLELALDMITNAKTQGLDFQWVGFDSLYGRSADFRQAIDDLGITYVADIPKDTFIYTEDPKPFLPAKTSSKGKKPKRLQTKAKPIRVEQWLAQQPESAFKTITIRNGTKGPLVAKFLHQIVWMWDGKSKEAQQVHLIARVDGRSKNIHKYSLSNAPLDTPLQRLAQMQAQRYWVERALQDAKSQVGMADYQIQGWKAWHHHMTMVLLAMLFILETKINCRQSYDILSAADIKNLLYHFLPKRQISKEELLRQMEIRHRKRKKDMQLHLKS